MPKAELHVHIEGTLEPEHLFELAARNGVRPGFDSVEALRCAYEFPDLESFLELYYEGTRCLLHERDFFELTWAYLERIARENVTHVEIFFDPQAHTERGVPFEPIITGIARALQQGRERLGMTTGLILCFLRDRSEQAALETLERARPFLGWLAGVGLDSSEAGHPPSKFERVFAKARDAGLQAVAHAGEEGPPEYIWEALDLLRVERIDHGVRCEEDAALLERIVTEQIPLTVCPVSNVRLGVFDRIEDHNFKRLLDRGALVTVNSDDPSYFRGSLASNYFALHQAFQLDRGELHRLARNSFEAAFLSSEERARQIAALDAYVSRG
jgi:adenosine deaminase